MGFRVHIHSFITGSCIKIDYFFFHFLSEEEIQALGMESGAIADSQLTASSEYNAYHSTKRSRLHTKEISALARGAWVSSTNDANQWLQIDVGKVLNVTHIATQGRNTYSPFQYVAKYKVQYSNDGQTFQFYKREGQPSDEVRNFSSFFFPRGWWLKQF